MASNLTPISIAAPGFYGLNLQDSPIGLPPEYALVAQNCIIDKLGRVGARKGWTPVNTGSTISGASVDLVHEYIADNGDVTLLLMAGGNIYSMDTTTGVVTLVYSGTWTIDTNWKAVNFNGKAYFFRRGEDPLVYDPTATPKVVKITAHGSYSGTVQTANEVLSAYGRLWTADTETDKILIKWSDTLIGEAWTGGGSGSLNLDTVFTNGTRPVVGLAGFNGFLVIFCDTSIVIYSGAEADPGTNLTLVDIIDGVGCISRDSIVDVGNDIFFLSSTGLRSLGRLIDQKSAPIFDISRNVRDQLIEDIATNANSEDVVGVYNDLDGFYLLTFKGSLSKTYCFDLKSRLEGNVCRTTTWTLAPNCYCMTKAKELYMGFESYVGQYSGYDDNGSSYRFIYRTSHLSGGEEMASLYKILKSLRCIVASGNGYSLRFDWGFDYYELSSGTSKVVGGNYAVSEYNIAEYGLAQYGLGGTVTLLNLPLSGYGLVFQIQIATDIDGTSLSIQQLDMFTKVGRLV